MRVVENGIFVRRAHGRSRRHEQTDTTVPSMNQAHARPPLRVALAQVKPRKGDVEANLEQVRALVFEARRDADIIVFPEACLSGYFLEGGVAESARTADEVAAALGVPVDGAPDVVIGFYERWRRRLYNSVVWLEPAGERYAVRHVHRKMFLPTYGVFDEARFVEPGSDIRSFDTRFGRVGLLVCEDAWHSLPATILAIGGAELIVVVSASPARDFTPSSGGLPVNLEQWDRLAPAMASEHGVFVAVAQLAGSEGGKLFPGGSIAVAPDGRVVARGPLFEEGVTVAALDATEIDRVRASVPLLSDLEQMLPHLERSLEAALGRGTDTDDEGERGTTAATAPAVLGGRGERTGANPALHDPSILEIDLELVERTLVEFIREEVRRRRGFERVVVGVSGGVDSAVSLFLACRALGPENVHGFRLPYRTSSPESLEHAELALEATGAHTRTIEISEPIDRYVEQYESDISPLRKGNLMARLRAVILFDQSARLHALPLGTGNKSERLLGYFTWHADDSPPINPIGDLFKTQVWALARHLGVPDVIIEKPATADLVKGVTDEDEIGVSYHQADPILHWMVRGYGPEELERAGFDGNAVEVVRRRLDSTHWKRELPTVAVLSSSAIGEFYLRPVDY
jgi:NAD+ synthetase